MKLTWRIWVLAVSLAIALISILNTSTVLKVLIFAIIIGIFLVMALVKSKLGRNSLVVLLIGVVFYLAISSGQTGVLISSIETDSEAYQKGLRTGQVIVSVNDQLVLNEKDYLNIISGIYPTNENVRLDITIQGATPQTFVLFSNQTPQIVVKDISRTNIQTGLDIRGGSRALVQAEIPITDAQLRDLIEVSRKRFDTFGISDVNVKGITDLSGNKFMLVEVAGATPEDVEKLLSQQGKFEARIANQTVFTGDTGSNKDITSVCRNDATCASITACFESQGGYSCNFQFTITLSPDAAQRHADITAEIPIDPNSGGQYLTENLTLILDDIIVDELLIGSSLKGQVTAVISIQGSGSGNTEGEAFDNTLEQMNNLQTVLIAGSLPFKVEIVKLDFISPLLGEQFTSLILIAGAASIILVGILVFARYRKFKMSMALLLTAFSELIIILGFASIIGWNLDLPSIAGILATIGTGVDQQIIILDEAMTNKSINIKQRMKRAYFIVVAAYFTSLAALVPLFWAGAGLFKGFAITTIIGITAGVLITRPAFVHIIRKIEE